MDGFARAHYYVGPVRRRIEDEVRRQPARRIHNVAAAEALVLAMKAGLDPALTLKVIADGGGSSRMLQVRGPMMVRGDYSESDDEARCLAEGHDVIADFAREVGCPTPLFATTAPVYLAAMAARSRRRGYRRRLCRAGRDGERTGARAPADGRPRAKSTDAA